MDRGPLARFAPSGLQPRAGVARHARGTRSSAVPVLGGPGLRALVALALCLGGCGEPAGQVELTWRFVDGDLDPPLFPGKQADTCDLAGKRGAATVRYDLGVVLRLTPASCGADATCDGQLTARFSCKRARGAIVDVPAREDEYVIETLVAVNPDDAPEFLANDACVVRPGIRRRVMRAGATVDLGVYQFLVAAIDPGGGAPNLDLDACFEELLADTSSAEQLHVDPGKDPGEDPDEEDAP